MMMQHSKTIYKVLSIGNFSQELPDGVTILSRPCIMVDELRKKWGDEYILFQKEHWNNALVQGKYFFGKFGFDKKKQPKIYMYSLIEEQRPPIPDYFILTVSHNDPFNKRYDIVRANPESFSKVFSSAFHKEENSCRCQSVLLLQNGDIVTIDNKRMVFSAREEKLLPA